LSSQNQPSYREEHLFVDLRQQRVMVDGEMVRLTYEEYRLLALLVQRAGAVVPRAAFLRQIWGISRS
jgi:two-component system KDP operon response regulator KdpE